MTFFNNFISLLFLWLYSRDPINGYTANEANSADFDVTLHNSTKNDLQLRPNSDRIWVSQIFEKAKREFQMISVSPECNRDVQIYLKHLQNQTLWAVKMMESTQWPTGAIFEGELYYVGKYKECLSVVENVPQGRTIKGQYCLVEARYGLPPSVQIRNGNVTVNSEEWFSAWHALLQYKMYDPSRVDRTKVTFAQCIPSSCTPAQLERALNLTLWSAFQQNGLNFDISVPDIACTSVEDESFAPPPSYYVVKEIVMIWFFILFVCTIYDFIIRLEPKKGKKKVKATSLGQTIVLYFSIPKNIDSWVSVKSDDIGVVRILRIFMMICIIHGHRFVHFLGYPTVDANVFETSYKSFRLEPFHTTVVDMFFMISGFLTFHFKLKQIKKSPAFHIPMTILNRWIRMMPVFVFLATIIIFMMPYWGEGPFWTQRVGLEAEDCARTLWANLLAVNNIVDTEHQCLIVSWYISVDLQLCVLGMVLLFFFTLNEKMGFALALITLAASFVTTFAVAYVNSYNGLIRVYMNALAQLKLEPEFSNFYIQTYTRIGPYLVGFLAAYATKKLQDCKYTLKKKQICIGGILAFIFGELSQYYGLLFYKINRPYNRVENALYATFSRTLFTSWGALITVVLSNRNPVWFGRIGSLKFFVLMDKLTYTVFLVNTVIQMYQAASQVTPFSSPGFMNLYWMVIGDVIVSYAVGFLLHICVEAPISNMSQFLQSSLTKLITTKKQTTMKDVEAQFKREEIFKAQVISKETLPTRNENSDRSVKCDTWKSKCCNNKTEFINDAFQNEIEKHFTKL